MGTDPHQTIPPRMRDTNQQNMGRNTPVEHLTKEKSKDTKGDTRNRIPESWW